MKIIYKQFVIYVLADVITFVYEVPFMFLHYINVDGVSLITLKKILQSATRFITNCDRYYKVLWIYYKLRQVLQSAMIITNFDSTDASKDSPRTNEKKIAKSLARSSKQGFLSHLFKLKFCTLNQLICLAKLIHVFGNRCSECK